jgi:hypothetical protein
MIRSHAGHPRHLWRGSGPNEAYGAKNAFKTRSGKMANLAPNRFLAELCRAAQKAIVG